MLSLFQQMLHQENYRIELGNDSKMRITGVQEGELFLAIRCKVFQLQVTAPAPSPAPVEPPPAPVEPPPSGEPDKKP